jgi:hypothetical protein
LNELLYSNKYCHAFQGSSFAFLSSCEYAHKGEYTLSGTALFREAEQLAPRSVAVHAADNEEDIRGDVLMFGGMRFFRIALGACVAVCMLGAARADEPYYRGKRVTIVINYAAGGPTDIEGRLFAKHVVKHLDGPASLIVQNMDGAGG